MIFPPRPPDPEATEHRVEQEETVQRAGALRDALYRDLAHAEAVADGSERRHRNKGHKPNRRRHA